MNGKVVKKNFHVTTIKSINVLLRGFKFSIKQARKLCMAMGNDVQYAERTEKNFPGSIMVSYVTQLPFTSK